MEQIGVETYVLLPDMLALLMRNQPIGSLMYSKAFSTNGSYSQVIQWHLFLGNGLCVRRRSSSRLPDISSASA
jgi:hypothetical protein